MKYFLHLVLVLFLLIIFLSCSQSCKLVCYYDITSANRVGPGKFTSKDMELALRFCTHIIYSYVTITEKTFTLTAISHEREQELAKMQILKKKHPKVKFLLSISGENNRKTTKIFLNLLEQHHYMKKIFIKSAMNILNKYKFDGLSLDFPLPTLKPYTSKRYSSSIWHSIVSFFKAKPKPDSRVNQHKDQLTALIQLASSYIKDFHGILTLNVLPNVDSEKYFDIAEIIKYIDFVILSAFDFYTPERNPNEADLMAPTKQINNRLPVPNIKDLYKYWHSQYVPRHKIVVGIAAFGRAWKMTKSSNSNGIPPIFNTDGPAAAGPLTFRPGFLAWPEICKKLKQDPKITRVTDPKAKHGVYAFRPTDSRGNFGIWISYEDPVTAGAKAQYVLNHNLGGVALVDLSLDDVHGVCSGEKFPILRSIKFKLSRVHPI